jgi:hypothetical protein
MTEIFALNYTDFSIIHKIGDLIFNPFMLTHEAIVTIIPENQGIIPCWLIGLSKLILAHFKMTKLLLRV